MTDNLPPKVKQLPHWFNFDDGPDWVKEAVAEGKLIKVGPGHWVKPGEMYDAEDGTRKQALFGPEQLTALAEARRMIPTKPDNRRTPPTPAHDDAMRPIAYDAANGYRTSPTLKRGKYGEMVVTRNGKILRDQARGVRMFMDAASRPMRYRIVYEPINDGLNPAGPNKDHKAWFLYHGGRRVIDVPRLVRGCSEPGECLDYLRFYFNTGRALE